MHLKIQFRHSKLKINNLNQRKLINGRITVRLVSSFEVWTQLLHCMLIITYFFLGRFLS